MEGTGALLCQREVLLREQVHGLVLVDLHAGAHVAVAMQEEGEGAGQVLTRAQEVGGQDGPGKQHGGAVMLKTCLQNNASLSLSPETCVIVCKYGQVCVCVLFTTF